MKADDKNDLYRWKATEGANFSLNTVFAGQLFESKVGKFLLAVEGGNFG